MGVSALRSHWKVSRQLDDQNVADRSGTDEKSSQDATQTQTQTTGFELVRGQGQVFKWCSRGYGPQGKTHYEKTYGFRTVKCLQIALYHKLGKLPELEYLHRSC